MKAKLNTLKILTALLFAVITFVSCEYDNYDAPSSTLSGVVTYQGAPLGVRSNEVELELWQPAYELDEKIPVHIGQDGTFKSVLFDGTYHLTLFNGPWMVHSDSTIIELNRDADIDIEVEPFYIIENTSISASGSTVNASFNVTQINNSRDLEFAGLYVSGTTIVDRINMDVNAARGGDEIASLDDVVNLSLEVPDHIMGKGYVFARIGVKTIGIPEMLYSQVVKIEL